MRCPVLPAIPHRPIRGWGSASCSQQGPYVFLSDANAELSVLKGKLEGSAAGISPQPASPGPSANGGNAPSLTGAPLVSHGEALMWCLTLSSRLAVRILFRRFPSAPQLVAETLPPARGIPLPFLAQALESRLPAPAAS